MKYLLEHENVFIVITSALFLLFYDVANIAKILIISIYCYFNVVCDF